MQCVKYPDSSYGELDVMGWIYWEADLRVALEDRMLIKKCSWYQNLWAEVWTAGIFEP